MKSPNEPRKSLLKQKTKILHSLLDKSQESTVMACSPGLMGSVVAVPCCHHLANKFTAILTKLVVCCMCCTTGWTFPFFYANLNIKAAEKTLLLVCMTSCRSNGNICSLRLCRNRGAAEVKFKTPHDNKPKRQYVKPTIVSCKSPPPPPPPVEAVSDAASRLRRVSMFTYNKADIEILCATS